MTRFLWKARQWWFRRLMLRDGKLSELNKHIVQARKRHAPVKDLYRERSKRLNEILGGVR